MTTSLLKLLETGGRLAPVDPATLHYTSDGSHRMERAEEEHFWFVVRREVVLRCLRDFLGLAGANPVTGLDVGCGTGFTSVFLTEHGYPTVGIDAFTGFERYRREGRGRGFLQGDIFSVEPEPEFDFVLLLDVLEHLDDDRRFLAQCLRFLKPGGVAILSAPAFGFLWSRIDEISGHRRRYTREKVAALVGAIEGARVEWQSYFYLSTLPTYAISRFLRRSEKSLKNAFESESEIPPAINRVALGLLRAESRLLPKLKLPVGSSLFSVLRKAR